MNAIYSKDQITSVLFHLTQIGIILSDAQPGSLTGNININTEAVLSMQKFLKIMGYEDDPDAEAPQNLSSEIAEENYLEEQMDVLCGSWTPWKKTQLPDIVIIKISKGKYLLKMIDAAQGIEYCSVRLDYDSLGNSFFIMAGEEISLRYFEPDIDDIDSIQLKETLYLRKKETAIKE